MTKNEIRDYLNNIKPFIKISAVAKQCNVVQQSVSMFINGYDGAVSYDKLIEIVDFIKNLG